MRIARDGLLAQLGEPAFHEGAQGAVIERGLAQEVGRCDRRGQLRDCLEQLGLARRAFAQLLDFFRRRDPRWTNEKLFLPADFRFPDDLREQAAHDGFDRAAVIICHPAGEFDQSRAEDGFLADQGRNRFDSFGRAFFQRGDDGGKERLVAEGNADARPDHDLADHCLGYAIVQLAPDGAIDDDTDKGGHFDLLTLFPA